MLTLSVRPHTNTDTEAVLEGLQPPEGKIEELRARGCLSYAVSLNRHFKSVRSFSLQTDTGT